MSTDLFAAFIVWLLYGSVIAAGISGLIRFRRLPLSLRYLAMLAIFDMVVELTERAMIKVLHMKSNLFMMPITVIGEIILLSLAYREVLQSATFNRLMPWVVSVFSLYALVDTFAGLGIVRYATGVQITSDLIQLGLALLYFWKLLSELRVERLRADPFFWVSVGLIVYVLGDMLIMLVSNYLMAHYSHDLQVLVILIIRPLFVISLYCAYALALWMRPQQSNSLSY